MMAQSINTLSLPNFSEMVAKNLGQAVEEAVYAQLRPIADKVARDAAIAIAKSVKGRASYSLDHFAKGPNVILQFNAEEIKL